MASDVRIHISHIFGDMRQVEDELENLKRAVRVQKTTAWRCVPAVRKSDRWLVYVSAPYEELLYEGEAITNARDEQGQSMARFGRIRPIDQPRSLEELQAFGKKHGWEAWEDPKDPYWSTPEAIARHFYEFITTKKAPEQPALFSVADGIETREALFWKRNIPLKRRALKVANGVCQACGARGFSTQQAPPFDRYLEVHAFDLDRENLSGVIAVCPNCHRMYHHGDPEVQAKLPQNNPF